MICINYVLWYWKVVQFIKILLNKKEYIVKGNRKIFLYFSQKKFYYAKIEGVK